MELDTGKTVNTLILLAFGLLVLTGIIVGVSALRTNQLTYSCATSGDAANGSTNCYTYTSTAWLKKGEQVNQVNTTVARSLANKAPTLRSATCVISNAMNWSNKLKIPTTNWTESSECMILHTKGALYQNQNWSVNYTVTFSNLTSQSTYSETPNMAYNLTTNVQTMTNQFSGQLGTAGIMFGVGLIISTIGVLAYGLYRKNE